ncbi:M20/M25/M40 family metallo-hydrolase [Schlesneria sp. DSM 10557]|uniref:M20/M25/M40 family metallo-hydrolase n=1 Tax=Schlesneria sp. DSM 10557 TaxID=3044399 RepID=UPI0035A120B9
MEANAAIELVQQLMAIPGRSREEGRVMEFIRDRLMQAGLPASAFHYDGANERIPGGGQVGNLIVRLPGSVAGPSRLLMAHVDTVPICVGSQPAVRGEQIVSLNSESGLGGDNRAGVAVIMTAALEILEKKLPHPPTTLLFVVQEEIGLYGARHVSADLLGSPELCFNWDGGDPSQICIGATGDYAMSVEIEGVASHAGVHPEEGVSAIAIAGLAIANLVENGWHGLIEKGTNRGTSNVGIIHAGEATNVVTPRLSLKAEARSHDPEFRKTIVQAYRSAFESSASEIRSSKGETGRVTFNSTLQYESFCLPADSAVVQRALAATKKIGLPAQTRIGNGGLDANWMALHGLPTVTLGCGQQDIHTTNETLHIPSFLQACQIALILATDAN